MFIIILQHIYSGKLCTEFYQNRVSFVEYISKNIFVFFLLKALYSLFSLVQLLYMRNTNLANSHAIL